MPVTVYELFYKDTDEAIPSKADYSGTIRIYGERGDIDLYDILKGRAPENENEIIIDRMHADNAKINMERSILLSLLFHMKEHYAVRRGHLQIQVWYFYMAQYIESNCLQTYDN